MAEAGGPVRALVAPAVVHGRLAVRAAVAGLAPAAVGCHAVRAGAVDAGVRKAFPDVAFTVRPCPSRGAGAAVRAVDVLAGPPVQAGAGGAGVELRTAGSHRISRDFEKPLLLGSIEESARVLDVRERDAADLYGAQAPPQAPRATAAAAAHVDVRVLPQEVEASGGHGAGCKRRPAVHVHLPPGGLGQRVRHGQGHSVPQAVAHRLDARQAQRGDAAAAVQPKEQPGVPDADAEELGLLLCVQYGDMGARRPETQGDVGEAPGNVPVAPEEYFAASSVKSGIRGT